MKNLVKKLTGIILVSTITLACKKEKISPLSYVNYQTNTSGSGHSRHVPKVAGGPKIIKKFKEEKPPIKPTPNGAYRGKYHIPERNQRYFWRHPLALINHIRAKEKFIASLEKILSNKNYSPEERQEYSIEALHAYSKRVKALHAPYNTTSFVAKNIYDEYQPNSPGSGQAYENEPDNIKQLYDSQLAQLEAYNKLLDRVEDRIVEQSEDHNQETSAHTIENN